MSSFASTTGAAAEMSYFAARCRALTSNAAPNPPGSTADRPIAVGAGDEHSNCDRSRSTSPCAPFLLRHPNVPAIKLGEPRPLRSSHQVFMRVTFSRPVWVTFQASVSPSGARRRAVPGSAANGRLPGRSALLRAPGIELFGELVLRGNIFSASDCCEPGLQPAGVCDTPAWLTRIKQSQLDGSWGDVQALRLRVGECAASTACDVSCTCAASRACDIRGGLLCPTLKRKIDWHGLRGYVIGA